MAIQPPLVALSTIWSQHRTLAFIIALLSTVGFGTLSAGAALVIRSVIRVWIRRSNKRPANLRPLRLPAALHKRTQSTTARTHIGALIMHSTLLPAAIARYTTDSVPPAPRPDPECASRRRSRLSIASHGSLVTEPEGVQPVETVEEGMADDDDETLCGTSPTLPYNFEDFKSDEYADFYDRMCGTEGLKGRRHGQLCDT
ncbi:hypothetical protein PENSPDRAFT_646526 [Peniophora sp. CONT]|nr:hypothetical protein PENSPDRAFT_646526 [Peniophora sp. CONT]